MIEFHNPGEGTGRQSGTHFIFLILAMEACDYTRKDWRKKKRL